MTFPIKPLKRWFQQERRDFPWRENPSPYSVWVSEIMLQQTQAVVVAPYFERWMNQFQTIESLAKAPLDSVIKAWEGLGYYSRARNLHAGARYVLEQHGGILPCEKDALSKIKGLGPYTVGAIQSFAFHKKAAAVDGNVIRVLTRYFGLEEDIAKPKTITTLRERAEALLPDDEPWVVTEALIELGATVCGRTPNCRACPLHETCKAYATGMTAKIPYKSKKTTITPLYRAVAVVRCDEKFLVERKRDLYQFPYFETTSQGISLTALQEKMHLDWKLIATPKEPLPERSHTFTRYRIKLHPVLFHCQKCPEIPQYSWLSGEKLSQLAFASGHRDIFQQVYHGDNLTH